MARNYVSITTNQSEAKTIHTHLKYAHILVLNSKKHNDMFSLPHIYKYVKQVHPLNASGHFSSSNQMLNFPRLSKIKKK